MSRLIPRRVDQLTPEQQAQHAEIARFRRPGADGQIGGPFDPWIRSPELGHRLVGMGNFLWERTTLPRRLIELAILVTGRVWRSNVEWVAHTRLALDNGVSQATIDDVFKERRPEGAPDDERLVYDVCRTLHTTRDLPLDLYHATVARFGEQGLIELIGTIGFYTTVSMTLNAFDVLAPVPAQPFPR